MVAHQTHYLKVGGPIPSSATSSYYKNGDDELMIGFIAIDLVRHCNLGCAKCCHFTPLHTEEWYKDLDSFEVEIKRLKEIVSPTCTFNLVGGEPFLHPDVEKFPGIIRKYIPDAYIFYLTNGTQLNNLSDKSASIIASFTTAIKLPMNPLTPVIRTFFITDCKGNK